MKTTLKRPSSSPHSSLSFPSDAFSNESFANDTITRIRDRPDRREVLRTITFNGDISLRPSLWDVLILILVVHNDSPLLGRQCYRFADTIFDSLGKWAAIHENGSVDEQRICDCRSTRPSTGSLDAVPVHRRNPEDIARIWDNFTRELQVMTQQVRISI